MSKRRPIADPEEMVAINVTDPARKTTKSFRCSRRLIMQEMAYFRGNALMAQASAADLEISVQCDLRVFAALLDFIQSGHKAQFLDTTNVVSIAISGQFLGMPPLVELCVSFMAEHLGAVVDGPLDLQTVKGPLLLRLAAKCSELQLEGVKDVKNKIVDRLFAAKLQLLLEQPQYRLCRCSSCGDLFAAGMSGSGSGSGSAVGTEPKAQVQCSRARNPAVGATGELLSPHSLDKHWSCAQFLSALRAQKRSWRQIFYRIWSTVNTFLCDQCGCVFPANQLHACRYHPGRPEFARNGGSGSSGGGGVWSCCSHPVFTFACRTVLATDDAAAATGCTLRQHRVNLQWPDAATAAARVDLVLAQPAAIVTSAATASAASAAAATAKPGVTSTGGGAGAGAGTALFGIDASRIQTLLALSLSAQAEAKLDADAASTSRTSGRARDRKESGQVVMTAAVDGRAVGAVAAETLAAEAAATDRSERRLGQEEQDDEGEGDDDDNGGEAEELEQRSATRRSAPSPHRWPSPRGSRTSGAGSGNRLRGPRGAGGRGSTSLLPPGRSLLPRAGAGDRARGATAWDDRFDERSGSSSSSDDDDGGSAAGRAGSRKPARTTTGSSERKSPSRSPPFAGAHSAVAISRQQQQRSIQLAHDQPSRDPHQQLHPGITRRSLAMDVLRDNDRARILTLTKRLAQMRAGSGAAQPSSAGAVPAVRAAGAVVPVTVQSSRSRPASASASAVGSGLAARRSASAVR